MQAGARSRTGGGTGFRALNDGNASTDCGGIAAIRRSSTDGDLYFRRVGCGLAAGDLNGDGITDLLVGAPGVSSPAHPAAGAVYLFTGSESLSGLSNIDLAQGGTADAVIYDAGERFGCALATDEPGGPTGADRIADLLAGTPGGSPDSSGSAYLIYGRTSFGTSTLVLDVASGAADFTVRGSPRFRLGLAVALGNFNGDGLADLFAGAPGADRPVRSDLGGPVIVPASQAGAVFGLLSPFAAGGSTSTDNSGRLLSLYGADVFHHFGQSIAVGEATGDNISDLVIAAPEAAGAWEDASTGIIYNMNAHGARSTSSPAREAPPRTGLISHPESS